MLFGKHVNKFYLRYALFFLLGILALIVVDVAQTFIPRYLGQIIDDGQILIQDVSELTSIILGILICALIMFLGRVVWRLSIFRASTGIAADLRREMFEKAEKLPISYYHANKAGNIMNWFTSDIDEIQEFYGWGTVMIIDAIFLSISVLISMIRLDIWMTLIAMAPILLIVIWGALVDRIMTKQWQIKQKEYDRVYDFSQENFTGIRVIKAFVKQNQEIHAFAKIARKNKDVNIRFARIDVLFDVIIEAILVLEMAFLLAFGGYFAYSFISGNPVVLFGHAIELSVGKIVEFVGYVELLIWPMIALGQIVSMRSRAKGSLKRISAFLDAPIDIKNPKNPAILKDVKGEIVFNHFHFTYPGAKKESLSDINLTVHPGERIGVIGKIGAGKTTLVNSLFRLYDIEKGTLFIDGIDLMNVDITSLRDNIAYSPQDNFLFGDKISANIAFSGEADEKKIAEAAEFADVASNIDDFPLKYDTTTGERGVTLSGGQKQRISIARAFYKNAPILVLDDCVSAVDVKTEETILGNIKEKRAGLTTLLIASRVSSVRGMDKIIVLDDGKLVGFDSHERLMQTCGLYQKMVYLQELEKEEEGRAS